MVCIAGAPLWLASALVAVLVVLRIRSLIWPYPALIWLVPYLMRGAGKGQSQRLVWHEALRLQIGQRKDLAGVNQIRVANPVFVGLINLNVENPFTELVAGYGP